MPTGRKDRAPAKVLVGDVTSVPAALASQWPLQAAGVMEAISAEITVITDD